MKNIFTLLLFLFVSRILSAQSITVSGQCITGTNVLNRIADVNGRAAYQGTGTVQGSAGVIISIYWLTPENLWVLDFDGQPYYMASCNRSTPPSTSNPSCTWSVVSGTSCTGAAPLTIAGTGTLPVSLSAFTAAQVGSQVQLNWKTQSENNNKGFEIQRSGDGNSWTKIGFVNGSGTTSQETAYQFTDATPAQGKNYYRLVQYDYDNRSSASSVVMVDVTGGGFYTLINSGNGQYRLQITSDKPVELTLVDLNGKKLFTKMAAQGLHVVDVTSYAKGVYLLQIRKGDLILTEKLAKQ